jgi:uncharacterized membrane protein
MTLKQYNVFRIIAVIILVIIISNSVALHNYVLPLAAIVVASLFLLFLRNRVNEIVADERDYEVSGKAARWAMQIYAWIAVAGFFLIYALYGENPIWGTVAYVLSYSACLLLILYAIIFRFFVGSAKNNKRWVAQVLSVAVLIFMVFAGYAVIKKQTLSVSIFQDTQTNEEQN